MASSESFPTRSQLWNGAILVSIAHAIFIAEDDFLSYEVSWENLNYNRNNSQSTRGTVTFRPEGVVGVFRDDHSLKAPWHSESPYSLEPFLKGIPDKLNTLAQKEALQYVLDEHEDYRGPLITAAFWGDGDVMTAAKPWTEVYENGAHLIRIELMELKEALEAIEEDTEFTKSQMTMLKNIYNRRLKAGAEPVFLTDAEVQKLSAKGKRDITKSLELLASINITINQ